ncbi:amidase, Asp-tRNAAsn/Glu-tRNAGln amidotransferase A subunit [Caulobacter sp. AP07]|uniref:amidase n=1 Tax=Caulobacter sp. AP07 TaxID=1144304 RepID=UPI000271ED22|nr:amidase [Caulobacter sp. AP07]EJL38418.1 amidase, Asp-tRNAAsn/Glu-tRNAGln amidotransferase A subunit [Caulobacter sp. AP07]
MAEAPDGTELAAMIRRGDLTAVEAIDAAIARVEVLQPRLNFLVAETYERARDRAKAGGLSGPFAGVPYLIKDMFDVVGSTTRYGSRFSAALPPAGAQGPMIDALERAGLVLIGRSALGEFGFLPTTEPLAFGPTRSPWNPERTPGGSSGGAAAAVASGAVPMADAADGGGSIRIPASACGLFGLKPSRGRMVGDQMPAAGFDVTVQHGLTRTVRDSATLFAATERRDGSAAFAPVGVVTTANVRRLRVGLVPHGLNGRPADPQVQAGVDATVRLLAGLGHAVRPTDWPIDGREQGADFMTLWTNAAFDVTRLIRQMTGQPPDARQLEPFTLAMAEMAAAAPAGALDAARTRLRAVAAAYDRWFADFDVILSPVLTTPPIPIGQIAGDVPFETMFERLGRFSNYTTLHNIAGSPAMSVPLHWTDDGLPVGLQFAARAGDERTLFELAFELEAAQPWAHRRPAVWAD